ncbi:hypothetical protein [Saccharothrix syringae]|uniref:Uncharacterized protein n=1 Tax=Saccharothrix syringae TaxID=103733 RepID=A0A5Q0HA86_SACSY|nr:hypothetical protein [Saccharothrix syringae]QFZ23157.1 hypothetical protein EKG83_42085 [Saccharothrix syringae]
MSGLDARPGVDLGGAAFGPLLRPFAEAAARALGDIRRAGPDVGSGEPGREARSRGLAAAWLDTLGAVLDPLAPFAEAEVGWLVEHVGFLRAPLDWLAGDGARIKDEIARWRQASIDLERVGRERRDEVEVRVRGWSPHAAEAFRRAREAWVEEAFAASRTCAAVADHVSMAGTAAAAVRGVVRDLLVLFAAEVVRNAAVALAAAEASGGATVAEFTGWAIGRAAAVLERITGHVAKLVGALSRILAKLEELARSLPG